MNTSYERGSNTTDEWLTPKEIINALGHFDLDPCAPELRPWNTADTHYTKADDGLSKGWFGRVWLNPPYSRPAVNQFIKKLADHGNGVALIFNRCDTELFHSQVFNRADAILFVRGRIRFCRPDGTLAGTPGCGSVLIAYGHDNVISLENSDINGKIVYLTHKK